MIYHLIQLYEKQYRIVSRMRSLNLESIHLFLLLSLFSSFPNAISRSHFSLKRGESISVGKELDFITSVDNSFTCGFFSLGTNANWFGIWFTNTIPRTVVWTANRDRPVNTKGSKVTLRRDGTMVLTDVDDSVVWQTNTTSTDMAAAELLDSGNLVLKNPQGEILWQSFNFPTDTLLPTQPLTKNSRLTSAFSQDNYGSGYFNLYYGSDNVLSLISTNPPDTSTIYWPNPGRNIYENGRTNYNSSRIAVLDERGRFHSSDLLQFSASDMGYGVKRRLKIDHDGNLRVYSLDESTGLWATTWQALPQLCFVKGVCGRNALCVYAPEPKCTCPPGFEAKDLNDWNLGCKATFDETLLNSNKVNFLEIHHTDFFGFDLNYIERVTLDTCRDMCLKDYNCRAFSYILLGHGVCYLKRELLNGFASPDFPASIYIKLPESMETSKPDVFHPISPGCGSSKAEKTVGSPSMYNFNSKSVRWVYVYSFASAFGAIEVMFVLVGWWFLFRTHDVPASVEAGYRMISSQFRRYSYSEIKKATNNFADELGRGGSGVVYRGVLSDERIVAVKKLGGVYQGKEEFFAEISTLGKINHMNLVRIWGFCSDRKHSLLVYEYIDNLSLDRHIFGDGGDSNLGWKQRYAVAVGTAKGLAYLHHECLEWVIHCDVKPENILLDGDFQPKIADFGLAKLSQREGPGSELSRVRGTKGYMAPEWALNHPITAKVDVFGYGVVILEMVRGRRLYDWVAEDGDGDGAAMANFVRKTKEQLNCRGLAWVEGVVDSRLEGKFSRTQAAALIRTGICCVEEDRNKRPTMASVVQTLVECEDEDEA